MQIVRHPEATGRTSLLLIASVLAAVFSISFDAAAVETKKKATGDESAKTASKKKASPKSSSKSAGDDSNAPKAGAETKAKAKTTPPEEARKADISAKDSPDEKAPRSGFAPNVSIAPEELVEYNAQPAAVKKLIEAGLALARQNLAYKFGSGDPANGGLDCSGFIYAVLREHGFTQVPRDSSGQYTWIRRTRAFRAVVSRKAESFELEELLPGDLLFWTGTYATANDPPISHVMLYLGTEKSTRSKVMIGSSEGRTYRGQKRNGVSVFDFVMPRAAAEGEQKAVFVGYGRIPGLRE